MRRIYLIGCLALLLILLPGCGSRSTSPEATNVPPTLSASSAEPSVTTQYLVGISTELPLLQMKTTKRFPIRERRIPEVALDELIYQEDLTGIVRMALAHRVSNAVDPEPLHATVPITWVLIIPDSESQTVLTWQDIRIDKSPSGEARSLVIEWAVSEVVPFANDETSPQASLQALITARDAQSNPDTGAGLWVDSLVVEETDEQGTKGWVLYTFASVPGAPGGDDWDITVCCDWLNCGGATGDWAEVCYYWGCTGLCD